MYILCTVLFVIGIYSIIAKRHIVKKIIGMVIIEYSVNLFLILVGYKAGGIAPILAKGQDVAEFASKGVDPLPQALVLTSIVIGLGTLALMAALAIRLYEKYNTFGMSEINRLRG